MVNANHHYIFEQLEIANVGAWSGTLGAAGMALSLAAGKWQGWR